MQIFVEHWGENSQFYPNYALFSTLGGIDLDHDFFHMSKLSKDQKKGLHQKWKTFSPDFKWRPGLRCIPESNYWRGCRWRSYSNYWGRYIPPFPGFGTPAWYCTMSDETFGTRSETDYCKSLSADKGNSGTMFGGTSLLPQIVLFSSIKPILSSISLSIFWLATKFDCYTNLWSILFSKFLQI